MQEEIETQRARLVEDVRLAKEECDCLGVKPDDAGGSAGSSADGSELAYENLKTAEVALHDFEIEHRLK